MKVRLGRVSHEMNSLELFDYIVVNHHGKLDEAVASIWSIVTAEKCRVNPRTAELK
jgi:guanylate kinase